jgi:hypothetical protein
MFDAVIVAYPDRWSRDNAKSKEGLEAFRKAGVKFFVGATEMNLWDPNHRFMLGMSAEVGEFMALQTAKKSLENRIERARKGHPAVGGLPFGRTYDPSAPEGKQWGIDAQKQAVIKDIAERYLAGESLVKLCQEYHLNHSYTCVVLRERCGDVWQQEFISKALNMHEVVPMAVPRLLDEATIKAVKARMEDRRTVRHGKPTHDYALNGFVFCGVCGYNLTGQPERSGSARLYYRHHKRGGCTVHPRPWVPAAALERNILRELFALFGNPAAIERAVKAAVPDCDVLLRRRLRLNDELSGISKARANILDLVTKSLVTMADAAKQLGALKERESTLRAEVERINAQVAHVDLGAEPGFVERSANADGDGDGTPDSILVFDAAGERIVGGNDLASWFSLMNTPPRAAAEKKKAAALVEESAGVAVPASLSALGGRMVQAQTTLLKQAARDRRALIEAVFGKRLPDGRPAGVYITPQGARPARAKDGAEDGRASRSRPYTYEIRGNLAFAVKQFAGQ